MKAYLDLVKRVLATGTVKPNRTGTDTIAITGAMLEHDMATGFPLLTTKRVFTKSVRVELEFFIKGLTDKRWLQERGCHIWDEWAHPAKAPYGHDAESKARMLAEPDLGPIYGRQWRDFDGVDQLRELVDNIKRGPESRRLLVTAWHPAKLKQMALPPCHFCFQVTVTDGHLNLLWSQRSVDVMLGLPFNLASYGLLLHLLARATGLKEGKLVGFLADTHIYLNHLDGVNELLGREPRPLPSVTTPNFTDLFSWEYDQTVFTGYDPHPAIDFPIAI